MGGMETSIVNHKLATYLKDEGDFARLEKLVTYMGAMRESGANKAKALEKAGISRMTLYRWERERADLVALASSLILQQITNELRDKVLEKWDQVVDVQLADSTDLDLDAKDRRASAEWLRKTFIAPLETKLAIISGAKEEPDKGRGLGNFAPVQVLVQTTISRDGRRIPALPDDMHADATVTIIDGDAVKVEEVVVESS